VFPDEDVTKYPVIGELPSPFAVKVTETPDVPV
jgi:hypothetical protein